MPDELPEGFPEYISQGEHSVTLAPGDTVEVDSRRFADWLVRELGLVDVTPAATDGFPEDLPGRNVLIRENLTIEAVKEYTREQLIALDGIGEKTADAIIAYFADHGGKE